MDTDALRRDRPAATVSTPIAAGADERADGEAARLARVADTWLAHGLATGPADRPVAEAAVRRAYAAAGLAPPRQVFWLPSPRAGALAAALLTGAAPSTDPNTGTAGPGGFGAAGSGGSGGSGSGGSGGFGAGGSASATSPVPGGDPAGYDQGGGGLAEAVAEVLAALRTQGGEPGVTDPGQPLRPALRTAPWATARAAAVERLGPAGWAAHWAAGGRRTWHLLTDRIFTPLRNQLGADLTAQVDDAFTRRARAGLLDAVPGQHDAAWLAAFDGEPGLAGLAGVTAAAGWWWPYERLVILTERPTRLHRDNLGRLHHDDGPALAYPDGFGLHAWRGMPIPAGVAAELPTLTVERIRAERNAEVRRVMLEHFGYDRYLRESRTTAVHRDEYGVLWRLNLPQDEPLVMVEVVNATPEPDGTRRTYWLRVPPDTRTARAGVAWTFGVEPERYAPLVQT
ncbi:DUF6745 domain-containing protein [Plantactinospora sp. KLBMP9567]|uniref:DUF6745 domain-containing protein n=1 Tax=Plantactinospora sp. KLBMP9567 TaxID=3085900 RepID=UPI002981D5A0|nr:hypothetical protein [Plantactinospora sp. KLBMP9567]MDW5323238.1 hypothetical protein [Plantactinospora sp. KLBMP9567]MDW5330703.1 hypothetical protein [Plantactinospora sp. KLBMP9567]